VEAMRHYVTALIFLHAFTCFIAVAAGPSPLLQDYAAQKSAFRQIEKSSHLSYFARATGPISGRIDFYQCVGPYEFLGDDRANVPNATYLALFTGNVEGVLEAYKVPQSLYSAAIAQFEQSVLAQLHLEQEQFLALYEKARDDFGEVLAADLNHGTASSSPLVARLEFDYLGECGAGEDKFSLSTLPPQSSVILISHWNYLYCQGLGKEPFSTPGCAGKHFAPPTLVRVVGSYNYQATWPDGTQTHGYIDFNSRDGDSVTISPRGISIH
jgi:hypothetical protein